MTESSNITTRRHWWQTPEGHIPYGGRLFGGLAMGVLFGAAGEHVFNNPWGWFGALLPLGMVAAGIWQEWREGY